MTRIIAVGVLFVAVGCSNAPIAGTMDAIWPARGRDKAPPDRAPVVPDVRPPGPDTRPAPAAPATDILPPAADLFPRGPNT